ncbi:MAG: ribonuclease E/G [Alphaproteobacteria bacterium]
MTVKMLIDATHQEETRVVVMRGNRVEEFDFETSTKKQLKGNIYLAKVTRVEPSLQAAFVEYGGNRQGFLAFNEIHPDYYQIPVADRRQLLAEEAAQQAEEAAAEDDEDNSPRADAESEAEAIDEAEADTAGADNGDDDKPAEAPEAAGGDDALDEVPRPRARPKNQYKIQEVIKRRQILLVQVVKEERGNKGAALTTYLSLAGRYCVLMPNTARGGGISRKIANATARKKLKGIVSDLEVTEGMGVIVRTAGMNRTKSEIKRDFEYLMRVWDNVRELTLQSSAPTLVYEEANLIKRAIRDLYTKDIDEVLVEGDEGYRIAKDFMRMMLASHAKKVQPYRGEVPLFHRQHVEQQLDSMHANTVQLRSGGYIVLSPTEALVAVDVNSGRSTREHNIEETALKTNMEAAEEVARQLRLRDLAGLIVIDFIDMEENRNNRAVERKIKDALKIDRARIQVGRISGFGLLEMSRQRLRPSLFEASMVPCQICAGTGYVRSTESTVLHVLRAIEEEGLRCRAGKITVKVPTEVALYLLNQKRSSVIEVEQRYKMTVMIEGDPDMVPPDYKIDIDVALTADEAAERRSEADAHAAALRESVAVDDGDADVDVEDAESPASADASEAAEDGDGKRKRRRRRRRRKSEDGDDEASNEAAEASDADGEQPDAPAEAAEAADSDGEEEQRRGRRRRGRRGGRRRRGEEEATPEAEADAEAAPADEVAAAAPPPPAAIPVDEFGEIDTTPGAYEPPKTRGPEPAPEAVAVPEPEPEPVAEVVPEPEATPEPAVAAEPEPEPVAASNGNGSANREEPPADEADDGSVETTVVTDTGIAAVAETPPADDQPKRRGWWQRRIF